MTIDYGFHWKNHIAEVTSSLVASRICFRIIAKANQKIDCPSKEPRSWPNGLWFHRLWGCEKNINRWSKRCYQSYTPCHLGFSIVNSNWCTLLRNRPRDKPLSNNDVNFLQQNICWNSINRPHTVLTYQCIICFTTLKSAATEECTFSTVNKIENKHTASKNLSAVQKNLVFGMVWMSLKV